MIKLVIDANILFATLIKNSKTDKRLKNQNEVQILNTNELIRKLLL